jgi:hypothetical protein
MCSLIDLLRIDQHGFASTTSTPTQCITNKCCADTATMKIWMHSESLEVSKTSSKACDVVTHNPVSHARDAETRTRSRMACIKKAIEVKAPKAIKRETIEIEHGVDVARASPPDEGVWSGGTGQIEQVVTKQVQAFVHRKSVLEEYRLLRERQCRSENGAVPGLGN